MGSKRPRNYFVCTKRIIFKFRYTVFFGTNKTQLKEATSMVFLLLIILICKCFRHNFLSFSCTVETTNISVRKQRSEKNTETGVEKMYTSNIGVFSSAFVVARWRRAIGTVVKCICLCETIICESQRRWSRCFIRCTFPFIEVVFLRCTHRHTYTKFPTNLIVVFNFILLVLLLRRFFLLSDFDSISFVHFVYRFNLNSFRNSANI